MAIGNVINMARWTIIGISMPTIWVANIFNTNLQTLLNLPLDADNKFVSV